MSKFSHARAIKALDDDGIGVVGSTEKNVYYSVGGTPVKYSRFWESYSCGARMCKYTAPVYASVLGDRTPCCHSQRLDKYRKTHPDPEPWPRMPIEIAR